MILPTSSKYTIPTNSNSMFGCAVMRIDFDKIDSGKN
jgi:hypothetical protein